MDKKTLVLTMYGRNDEVEEVSVNQYETDEGYYSSYDRDSDNPARRYCATINNLELKDGAWIYAQIIKLNQKVKLMKPLQFDIINKMVDRDLQLVIEKTENSDLLRVLLGADDATKEKIFKNTSKHNVNMLKEDLASLHGIGEDEIKICKDKIVETIQKLIANGNISIAWGKK